jgi:NAD(P)-dependent dehydrogenase (short-subunit alcohol dehydrogenase family)
MAKKKALILGARLGSGNIGDMVGSTLHVMGWDTVLNDCSNGDGARPRGGNIPTREIAEQHGYEQGPKGHYMKYDAPSVQYFAKHNPDALIITLGKTYKGHFADIRDYEIANLIKANLILPLECARRYVDAVGVWRRDNPDALDTRHIVFVGSYAYTHPFTNGTLYCAAKAGLNMAARTLGWELTDYDFRVHIVHPYHVQGTPMWKEVERGVMESKNMSYEEADAYNRKDLKMPDLLTAEEVANVIATLLTVKSMEWTAGTPIELFGGSR